MRSTRARLASIVLGLGLCSALLTACGAGARPTIGTSGGGGAAAPTCTITGTAGQASGGKQYTACPPMAINQNKTYIATLKTNMGDIKVQLDAKNAPITVNNFVFLARDGYYNNVTFHRIIKGFMIQSGDPTGTGAGGPGFTIPDESSKESYQEGSIAMANTGRPNSGGAQFFICEGSGCASLPKTYSLFGKVSEGIDTVYKIAAVPVTANPGNPTEQSKPTQPVTITTIEISEQ